MTSVPNQIRQICNLSYTKATLPIAVNKCKHILKDYARCMCGIMPQIMYLKSSDLSLTALTICKKNCGFCQININQLYEMIKNLPFHMIQKIIAFDDIKKKNDILFTLLENHLYSMSKSYIQDIIENIFQPKKPNQTIINYIVESDVLFILTNIICKNIERKKKVKQEPVFILFYEIVKYINSFNYDEDFNDDILSCDIWRIVKYIIEESLLDQIDNNVIVELITVHFVKFKQIIQFSFKKMIEKQITADNTPDLVVANENWKRARKSMFESMEKASLFIKEALLKYDQPICHKNKNMYAFILKLSVMEANAIMSKVTSNAMIRLMSYVSADSLSMREPFNVHANPVDIINTSICQGMNLKSTLRLYVGLSRKPYIIYDNENGQLGIDAGGLTRDFYSQYFLQFKPHMAEKDDYMTFDRDLKGVNSLQRMRFAGVITAYSILVENISPNIRFHPILSYFIINGSTIDIDDVLEFLVKYDIEYIKNIKKVGELTKEEYVIYLDMPGGVRIYPKEEIFTNTFI